MTTPNTLQGQIDGLNERVIALLALLERMHQENQGLQHQLHIMEEERSQLIEKNELARSRVEAMISRLKSMESES